MEKLFVLIAAIVGLSLSDIFPTQQWNHHGEDEWGLIAPASTMYGRKLIVTGGFDGYSNRSERWDFDLFGSSDWTITPEKMENLLRDRQQHTANVYKDFLFYFGGNEKSGAIEISGICEGSEHIIQKPDGPNRRIGHTATLYNEDLYLFGGWDFKTEEYRNDLWRANISYGGITWELIDVETPPQVRAGHSAIIYQDSLYIFGGRNADGFRNDVWRFDFRSHLWVRSFYWKSRAPEGRSDQAGVYWGDEGLYIWGGYGESGFMNDMWRFDLQHETWEKVFQGEKLHDDVYGDPTIPSSRAHMAFTVIDDRLVVLGGQITLGGVAEKFWSPTTSYVNIYHPEDFGGDVWAYIFPEHRWEFVGCLPPWANITNPNFCRSRHAPKCLNDCNGNGVCVRDGICMCRGEWTGEDCSYNTCVEFPYKGYDVDVMDRVLVTESILKVGKALASIKSKLEYIQQRLPPYDEFTSCIKWHPLLGKMLRDDVSVDGLQFYQECLQNELGTVYPEFNDVLQLTA